MQIFFFYLLLPLIYLVSLIPFKLLYIFSDMLFILLYHITAYRKKVVLKNLRNSFPHKTSQEISVISKKYYQHFCDVILETIKVLSLKKEDIIKRYQLHDSSLFTKLYSNNKNILILMGHYGNWEWTGLSLGIQLPYPLAVVYKPLSNKYFNNLILKIRTRFGIEMFSMNSIIRDFLQNQNKIGATAFVADQSPSPEVAYWTRFLNQDTAVFMGVEKLARRFNYPVVFACAKRIKRGYYEISPKIISSASSLTLNGQITETYIKLLEEEIIKQPELWLWSHRRWKHQKPIKEI